MPRIKYVDRNFRAASLVVIDRVNQICQAYADQGFILTLRQLYYQFVARGLIANNVQEYKKLGAVVNDGRLAGLIDWRFLEDRTRNMVQNPHWQDAEQAITSIAEQYRIKLWETQPNYVEVWVEKEALAGIVSQICKQLDVPHFACRGYVSQSEMHDAAQRMRTHSVRGKRVHILHMGDHDPSGIDMTRDIEERMTIFRASVLVNRIALNMDQIEELNPPPNPAKDTDARFADYRARFGDESWELDAIEPIALTELIRQNVVALRDEDLWKEAVRKQESDRRIMNIVKDKWDDASDWAEENYGEDYPFPDEDEEVKMPESLENY